MAPVRQTRLACYFCNEYLVGKREDDLIRNCFGYSYGPTENPFLHPKLQKKWYKVPTDEAGLQTVLLKCGHAFHKACLRKSMRTENGGMCRTGICPICAKSFILGRMVDIHLKVNESEKVAKKRQKQFEENELRRMGIRSEIEKMQNLIARYNVGVNRARQTILSDTHIVLKSLRDIRRRKRLLDDYQAKHLEPLEELLDDIYDENFMWKQLLGQKVRVDEDGYFVTTPRVDQFPSLGSCTATDDELPYRAIPIGARPASPGPLDILPKISRPLGPDGDPRMPRPDAGHDYSQYWDFAPRPANSAARIPLLRPNPPPTPFNPTGFFDKRPPTPEWETEYDFKTLSDRIRAKIKKEIAAKEKRKLRDERDKSSTKTTKTATVLPPATPHRNRTPMSSRGVPPYTPKLDEHWDYSDSSIGSDYRLAATSAVRTAELEQRADILNVVDPDKVFRKWRKILSVTLKFDCKYENGFLNWEEDYPDYATCVDRRHERAMLDFVEKNWPRK